MFGGHTRDGLTRRRAVGFIQMAPAIQGARESSGHLRVEAIEFEHAPEDDEDMVEQFKAFLDEVTPEDFV